MIDADDFELQLYWAKGYAQGVRAMKDFLIESLEKINDLESKKELEVLIAKARDLIKRAEPFTVHTPFIVPAEDDSKHV